MPASETAGPGRHAKGDRDWLGKVGVSTRSFPSPLKTAAFDEATQRRGRAGLPESSTRASARRPVGGGSEPRPVTRDALGLTTDGFRAFSSLWHRSLPIPPPPPLVSSLADESSHDCPLRFALPCSAVGTIVYPLTSEAAPNEDQVVAIKFGAAYARPALPTEDCCAAAKSALETNCQCDQNLPALAATLGIDATQVGLEGAINQCALMCGLGTVEC